MCIPPPTPFSDPFIAVGAVLAVVGFAGREFLQWRGDASRRPDRWLRWTFVAGVALVMVGVAGAALASRCGAFG